MTKKKKAIIPDNAKQCFEDNDYNPLAELIEIARDNETDISLKAKINFELLSLLYPQIGKTEGGQIIAETETYEQRLRRIRASANEPLVPYKLPSIMEDNDNE